MIEDVRSSGRYVNDSMLLKNFVLDAGKNMDKFVNRYILIVPMHSIKRIFI